jgi:hypothetical protein
MSVGIVDRPVATEAPEEAPGGLRGRFAALRRRLRMPVPDPTEVERERVRRLAEARAVLERAREVVAHGWVQDAFYVVRDPQGRLRPVSPFGLLVLDRTDVAGACLVGAVAHASAEVDRRQRRGPAALAVDTLWDTLGEQSGRWHLPAAVEATHPAARAARVRDLARWNDEPQRTRQDVLDLIDRSVSRTIFESVR